MARVTITWAGNEGHHDGEAFREVRKAAIRAVRAKGLPDVGNTVGYEAHCIIQARARKRLGAIAKCVRDGIETSVYEGDEAKIRAVAESEYGISAYSFAD